MKIFLVYQKSELGYDTYDSFVCIAEDKAEAKRTSPCNFRKWVENDGWHFIYADGTSIKERRTDWANNLSEIKVKEIGEAKEDQKKGVVCSSFHAG